VKASNGSLDRKYNFWRTVNGPRGGGRGRGKPLPLLLLT